MPSFSICIYFISFSCPIVFARISSTMLERSGERVNPCLGLDYSGKASSFPSLITMLAVNFFVDSLYQGEKNSQLVLVYWEFLLWMGIGFFSNAFSASIDIIMFFDLFCFLSCQCDGLHWLNF